MEPINVIFVKDKWEDYTVRADDNTIDSAALILLEQRVLDGFWYDGYEQEYAQDIVNKKDGDAAWSFLDSRRDYEYERVEAGVV